MRIRTTSGSLLAVLTSLPSFADRQFPSPDQELLQPLADVQTSHTRSVTEPWRVGIQAGHWKISDLPDKEQWLRVDTGAR